MNNCGKLFALQKVFINLKVGIYQDVVLNALRLNNNFTKIQIRASKTCPQAFLLAIASYGFQRSLKVRRCHPEARPVGAMPSGSPCMSAKFYKKQQFLTKREI